MGAQKETAAATNVKTAGKETDTKVRQRVSMQRGNERKRWGKGVQGKGRDRQARCQEMQKKDGDTAEPREEETIECIQVCVNIREWQDISEALFLVLELSLG